MTVAVGTGCPDRKSCRAFVHSLIDNDEKVVSSNMSKKHIQFETRVLKPYLLSISTNHISYRFPINDQKQLKNHGQFNIMMQRTANENAAC